MTTQTFSSFYTDAYHGGGEPGTFGGGTADCSITSATGVLEVGGAVTFTVNDTTSTGTYLGSWTVAGETVYGIRPDEFANDIYLGGTAGAPIAGYPISATPTSTDPVTLLCFLPGTLIATPSGEIAVEDLSPGDLVLTADGRAVPVAWLGWQSCATLFTPQTRRPVVIAAGALGDGLPRRALRVTSDHALLLGDVLVQAGALVNGTTIRRMTADELGERFTVFHVECAAHELLLAEGVPAESFLDSIGRGAFDNAAEHPAPHGARIDEMDLPRAKSARQVPPALRARLVPNAAAA